MFTFEENRPIDLIAMGRVAVDLYSQDIGLSLSEAQTFRKYLGGCAGNIAVGCSRLGLKVSLLSCVGQDEMGTFLKETLIQEGVDVDLIKTTPDHLTGLVLLGIKPPKDFPLLFYRKDCADMKIKPEDIRDEELARAKALLITGTGLSTPEMRHTSQTLIQRARKLKTKIIIDLDYRPVLWGLSSAGDGETRYIDSSFVSAQYQEILGLCDLIVGTEEEIAIAGGFSHLDRARQKIQELSQAPIVMKAGEKGAYIYLNPNTPPHHIKPFSIDVLNVLGAGDGFISGLLGGLLRGESFEQAGEYASASGALVASRHGCSVAIPHWQELKNFIQSERLKLESPTTELEELHLRYTTPLIHAKQGFRTKVTTIASLEDPLNKMGLGFKVIKLPANEGFRFRQEYEFAALLLTGQVEFNYEGNKALALRSDYFTQAPIVLHAPAKSNTEVFAITDAELLLVETFNEKSFSPLLFDAKNLLEIDQRGQGQLEGSAHREVRTVFDKRNRPQSNLVLGEIISFQGRWSSYPSHYHAQPEIYHYRFSEPQGFAFAENGEQVLRIKHFDTYLIEGGLTHAHAVAPGYALYTLWFIRHLDNNPYLQPTFLPEHEWTRKPSAELRARS